MVEENLPWHHLGRAVRWLMCRSAAAALLLCADDDGWLFGSAVCGPLPSLQLAVLSVPGTWNQLQALANVCPRADTPRGADGQCLSECSRFADSNAVAVERSLASYRHE